MVRAHSPFDAILEILANAHALDGGLAELAGCCDDERIRCECDALRASLRSLEETLRLYGLRIYADRAR